MRNTDTFSLLKMKKVMHTWILLCDECKRPLSKPEKSQGRPQHIHNACCSYYEIGISQMFPKYEGKCPICQGGDQPLKHIKPARFESDLE